MRLEKHLFRLRLEEIKACRLLARHLNPTCTTINILIARGIIHFILQLPRTPVNFVSKPCLREEGYE
jgi:hypothetical protein